MNLFFASLILLTALPCEAMSLRDFLKKQSPLRASVKLAYLRELESFLEDPAYCARGESDPGAARACRQAVHQEQLHLVHPDWGREWNLDSSQWVPTFGEVLIFRKSLFLNSPAALTCEATLSIPANKPRTKRFSFYIYCNPEPR